MRYAITLAALMMLTGCACAKSGQGASYCAVAQPIWLSDADVLTVGTEEAVLMHNETWEKLCK